MNKKILSECINNLNIYISNHIYIHTYTYIHIREMIGCAKPVLIPSLLSE